MKTAGNILGGARPRPTTRSSPPWTCVMHRDFATSSLPRNPGARLDVPSRPTCVETLQASRLHACSCNKPTCFNKIKETPERGCQLASTTAAAAAQDPTTRVSGRLHTSCPFLPQCRTQTSRCLSGNRLGQNRHIHPPHRSHTRQWRRFSDAHSRPSPRTRR